TIKDEVTFVDDHFWFLSDQRISTVANRVEAPIEDITDLPLNIHYYFSDHKWIIHVDSDNGVNLVLEILHIDSMRITHAIYAYIYPIKERSEALDKKKKETHFDGRGYTIRKRNDQGEHGTPLELVNYV
ncbi:hypothetical protein ACJX0J_012923, partial [Zea mays]